MKELWLSAGSAVAFVAASSIASAADLSMPLKAPPPPPTLYDWTGFYIGASIGGVWANGLLTNDLTGVSFSTGTNQSGVAGGGTVGYNFQIAPNFVLGIEGTLDGTSLGTTSSIGTNWVATIAGRAGVAANNWLFYAKGGGGWADNTGSIFSLTTGTTVTVTNTPGGWLVGGGIEYGFAPSWTVKLEYDYLGLTHWNTATPFPLVGEVVTAERNFNMVMVEVNYRFPLLP